MAGTLIQVAVVLAALFAVPPLAEAAPGLGSVFAPRGTQPPSEAGGFDPFGFPKQVIAALTPCRPGGDSGEASGKCAPRRPADQHLHHHAQQPTAATPLASRSGTPAAAPAAKPAAAPAAAPAANPAARPAANPAASPAATPAATTTSTAAPSTAAPTASERMEPTGPMAKAPVTDECLLAYQKLTNGTTDDEDFDILSVLLDYGGFPGQVSNIKWEKNATEGRPNRWTYFYGDTDYKTYIRLERGAVNSTRTPTRGTTPEEIQGDIYWSPKNFCGKLRHSKYTQAPLSESPDRRPRISSETQPEICSIGDSRKGKTLRCSGFLADKAPLGPALLATLIG